MGTWRYAPEEMPRAVSRTVRWRWPGERLLGTFPCEAEWPTSAGGWAAAAADDLRPEAPQLVRRERGAVGVTEARLVYRNLDRHGLPIRAAAWIFALPGALGYIVGGQGMMPLMAAAMALAAWIAGHLVEVFGLGGGSIELGRVLEVDWLRLRIHGVDRWGIHYRLRLAGPDLERVARLLAA